ncbi:LysM peptidoglycan-binding domain-containing protein [Arenibacter latericius]|uniref:LysM peptidoglycan-binding domain-containing protein n=1 Tax=Arenibacter latericius TaxID=86104 RepID=UPI001F0A35F3|nr:LysM peptidoglycan-binding domain-containing protein [Arenibacter latericius]
MKLNKKAILSTFLMLFIGVCAVAQKFTTHSVKEGETLESIAKQYKVSELGILNYNKEVKKGQAIKANTILVIPLVSDINEKKAVEQKTEVGVSDLLEKLDGEGENVGKQEPVGFISHRARRRETLYGIARKYNVTEDDIKRYNRELYSVQLKRGMTLKVPKYRKAKEPENVHVEENYEVYTVQPKETRWSIAHKYGITQDSLLVLNPDLSKTTDHLANGQELLVPKLVKGKIKDQQTQLYTSYTVPPKQTLYSLQKKFDLSSEELMKLNPEIKERGGLKEGMVLQIPVKTANSGVVNTENFNFYEVKPKQTEFSLTRKFGVTYRELLDLNPDLKDGLKAGMVLKLPKGQTGNFDVKNALILDKINLVDSINPLNKPKVMFLLPFRFDRLDLNDTEGVSNAIRKRKDVKYSLGLYSGALMAIDSVAKLGISVDVKTFDTELSLNRARSIMQQENLNGVSAIFGPLDPVSLKEVALIAANYNVPVIAPMTEGSDLSLSNVYFTLPSKKVMREQLLDYISDIRTDQKIIVIADSKSKSTEALLLRRFPGASTVTLKEDRTLDINRLSALLSETSDNYVFLETEQATVVHHAASLLNSLVSGKKKIKLLTTDKNSAFDNEVVSYSHLSNLRFTYPSPARRFDGKSNSFTKAYSARFGSEPDEYAIRGFDITYDLLLKLAYKNNLADASKLIGGTEYTGNKFNYAKNFTSGYFNTAAYILEYKNMEVVELKEE